MACAKEKVGRGCTVLCEYLKRVQIQQIFVFETTLVKINLFCYILIESECVDASEQPKLPPDFCLY